ncbi:MAG: DUF1926 domain-containing protein [Endomicrobium sp.]|jgi:alpha-amylase|nr:DUF1926 domain-containing protein [Endomicrobium sp.]
MGKIKFVFCVHNHQPIGNFGWVFDNAYKAAYEPLLDIMSKHPKIKWCMHSSGMLWEYFTKERPKYIKQIKHLINIGSLEILSGGYYEPILSAIPDNDKIGQIKKMNSYLRNKFNIHSVNGMWMAERVWEPSLAKPIAQSGIKYTVLDDTHFGSSGMDIEKLDGYYTTEEQGFAVNVFPISKRLRYLIPYCSVDECINYFKSIHNPDKDTVIVFADDGEKFGLWSGSQKLVYQDEWLDKFFTAIEENSDIIETATFSEILESAKPSGKVYLPCASYFEMSKWVLPSDIQKVFEAAIERQKDDAQTLLFMRGGFWRGFLSKYEEAGNMRNKMLYISKKINAYIENKKNLSQEILEYLYAGQCNCAYWHGSFGGLYFPHLRNAVYNMLIRAEEIYNESIIIMNQWTCNDINCDMTDEYLYESKNQNIYVKTEGGSIFEWDIFKIKRNFADTLTRRYEPYHEILKNNLNNLILSDLPESQDPSNSYKIKTREFGLEKFLVYDKYQRSSLLDHFFDANIKREDFEFADFAEKGDFINSQYSAESKGAKITLYRDGKAGGADFSVKKTIIPKNDGYCVEYQVKNISSKKTDICFSPEQVFAFSCRTDSDIVDAKNVNSWTRFDENLGAGIEVKFSKSCDLFSCPIETVAYSEGVFERIFQGTALIPLFKASLKPSESLEFSFETIIKL